MPPESVIGNRRRRNRSIDGWANRRANRWAGKPRSWAGAASGADHAVPPRSNGAPGDLITRSQGRAYTFAVNRTVHAPVIQRRVMVFWAPAEPHRATPGPSSR